jgi:replication-associated recombination protein RarA
MRDWATGFQAESLDDFAFSKKVRERIQRFGLKTKMRNHLLLFGTSGIGKTAVARFLAKQYNAGGVREFQCETIASLTEKERVAFRTEMFNRLDGGVNGLTRFFAASDRKLDVFIINEFHDLAANHRNALKSVLENGIGRAIITTNSLDAIDAAIQSRCDVVNVDSVSYGETQKSGKLVMREDCGMSSVEWKKELIRVGGVYAKRNGYETDNELAKSVLDESKEHLWDLRKYVRNLQYAYEDKAGEL